MTTPNVTLISMPWASTIRPTLALGVLAALVRGRGYACTVRHPNLRFAALVGAAAYERISITPEWFPVAEHFFAVDLFGADTLDSDRFLASRRCDDGAAGGVRLHFDTLLALRNFIVPAFLDDLVDELAASSASIVGFSCVFNQILPSLSVARRLRQRRPDLTIVLGGASVHGPLGNAYARAFADCVDYVFTGEADVAFLEFLDAYARDERVDDIAGMTSGGRCPRPAPLVPMDAVPMPDFDDYFAEREAVGRDGGRLPPVSELSFESARGCWWGAKHHCVFCGLNGQAMEFRTKPSSRVVEELSALARRYGITRFAAADNIMSNFAYTDLLPKMAALGFDVQVFYEIKANVTRDKVAALRVAGVSSVQPGIESFSDGVLSLMRKGISAAQNIQLLRLLHEYGIAVFYNLLVGFPGERETDYEEMLDLLPRLSHLPPPVGSSSIQVEVQRFSPFHEDPAAFGLVNMRAADWYQHLFPETIGPREAFAFVFDFDLPDEAPFHRYGDQVDAILDDWAKSRRSVSAHLGPGFIEIRDVDNGVEHRMVLAGETALAFLLTDAPTTIDAVARGLEERLGRTPKPIDQTMTPLLDAGIVVEAGRRLVHVAPFSRPHTSHDLATWCDRWSNELSRPLMLKGIAV